MTALAVAAPNPAAADAAEEVARAGGSAVDAAIAAALVAMVNEVGLVSLSSGGFVAVQPAAGSAYTVDGWVDRPGIGRAPDAEQARTWDVTTAYGGGVTITIGPGSAVDLTRAAIGACIPRAVRWCSATAAARRRRRCGGATTSSLYGVRLWRHIIRFLTPRRGSGSGRNTEALSGNRRAGCSWWWHRKLCMPAGAFFDFPDGTGRSRWISFRGYGLFLGPSCGREWSCRQTLRAVSRRGWG